MNNLKPDVNKDDSNELNLIEIIVRLWEKKFFIIKITSIFILLGLFIAIFSSKEYTADCVIVPQIGQKNSGSLNTLAALAGIQLGGNLSNDALSPFVYENIIDNINLKKELIYTPIKLEGSDTLVTIKDYYTNPKYQKFSLIGFITKYTIGLPFVILKAIRGEQEMEVSDSIPSNINLLSKDEYECLKIFSDKYSLNLDAKNGYVYITASMPEPLLAAQVVETLTELLQKYLTKFKIEKAESTYKYIKQRHEEAEVNLKIKRLEYAKFLDENRTLSTAKSKIQLQVAENDYNVANSIYNELTSNLLQSELKVKEDTPSISVIEPVVVPMERSKPKRVMILFVFTFLGGVISCVLVFVLDYLKKQEVSLKMLNKW